MEITGLSLCAFIQINAHTNCPGIKPRRPSQWHTSVLCGSLLHTYHIHTSNTHTTEACHAQEAHALTTQTHTHFQQEKPTEQHTVTLGRDEMERVKQWECQGIKCISNKNTSRASLLTSSHPPSAFSSSTCRTSLRRSLFSFPFDSPVDLRWITDMRQKYDKYKQWNAHGDWLISSTLWNDGSTTNILMLRKHLGVKLSWNVSPLFSLNNLIHHHLSKNTLLKTEFDT